MFGWSISFLFINFFAAVPIISVLTKTYISIFLSDSVCSKSSISILPIGKQYFCAFQATSSYQIILVLKYPICCLPLL